MAFDPFSFLPSSTRLRQLQRVAQRLVNSMIAGNYRSVFRGTGIEFDEVREYVEGDDTRLIDWNVSSRFDSVYTKTFREEREMTLFLIVDVSGSLNYGSGMHSMREVALVTAALLTLAAVQNNDKVGGALFTQDIELWASPHKGRAHALRLLHNMVSLKPRGTGSNLAGALETVARFLKKRSVVVIMSDFQTDSYQREMALVAGRHEVIALRFNDAVLYHMPFVRTIPVMDTETGKSMYLNAHSKQFLFFFEQFWQSQRQQWVRNCRKCNVSVLEISRVDQVVGQLITFLRHRRARR